MSDVISGVLEIVGLACLCVAAGLVFGAAGAIAATGGSLLLVARGAS